MAARTRGHAHGGEAEDIKKEYFWRGGMGTGAMGRGMPHLAELENECARALRASDAAEIAARAVRCSAATLERGGHDTRNCLECRALDVRATSLEKWRPVPIDYATCLGTYHAATGLVRAAAAHEREVLGRS